MHISNLFSKLFLLDSQIHKINPCKKVAGMERDDEVGQTDRHRQTALTFQWPAAPQDSATPVRGSWSGEGWWSCRQQGCTLAQTWWSAGCPIARLRRSWKCSAHSPGTVTTLHANTLSGVSWAFHATVMIMMMLMIHTACKHFIRSSLGVSRHSDDVMIMMMMLMMIHTACKHFIRSSLGVSRHNDDVMLMMMMLMIHTACKHFIRSSLGVSRHNDVMIMMMLIMWWQ